MKSNWIKILLIFIMIIGGIFVLKNVNHKQNSGNSNYTKTDILKIIASETNKSNYEVEYTIDGTRTNRKYLNKKMKIEAFNNETNTIMYVDFEKDTNTSIDEEKKIAIILELDNLVEENYIPKDVLEIIKNESCTIENEERISNREAIVLNYNGKEKIGNQFLFNVNNSTNKDNKVDELKYNVKIWIDKETGLLLQTIIKADKNEMKITYDLKLNSVTENDVTKPNLSQYKVTDFRKK